MYAWDHRHFKMGVTCAEILGVLIKAIWRWKLWLHILTFCKHIAGNESGQRPENEFCETHVEVLFFCCERSHLRVVYSFSSPHWNF